MLASSSRLHAIEPLNDLFSDARTESVLNERSSDAITAAEVALTRCTTSATPIHTSASTTTTHAIISHENSADSADSNNSNTTDSTPSAAASKPSVASGPVGVAGTVVLQPLESLVALPEIDRRDFSDWTEFHAHLDAYSTRTHQIYRTATSTPVTKRNAGIKPHPYTRVRLVIPDAFRQYAKTIACTHAGVARHRTRGLRPERASRCMGCPARMNVCVRHTDDRGWRVCVTKHTAQHNHAVAHATFVQYPENRRVTDPDVLRTINVLRRVGTEPAKILQYIHEDTPSRPTLDDVVALLAKMKREADEAVTVRT